MTGEAGTARTAGGNAGTRAVGGNADTRAVRGNAGTRAAARLPPPVGGPGMGGARGSDAATATGTHPEIWRDGMLAGHDPRALAARFGTPLFAYDLDAIGERAALLRTALSPAVDVAYAVKANPSLAVIRRLAAAGVGADVSSEGELEAARRAGMRGPSTVVTGPAKSGRFLDAALAAGARAIVVESPGELGRVEDAARRRRIRANVLFRLSVDDRQAFGMAWADLVEVARRAVRSPWLEPMGVHAFGVHAELDAAALARHAARVVGAGTRLAEEAGFGLRLVDAGGGLGIPYGDGEPPLDVHALGERLDSLACELGARASEARGPDGVLHGSVTARAAGGPRMLLEPGRFLVGPAGAFLARVADVKHLHGRAVTTLDGGINHLLAPALVGRGHRLRLVPGEGPREAAAGRPEVPVTFAGPLCTDLDVLARPDAFPEPRVGDLLVVLDAGAYGFTEAMPWFLSHRGPAEVALEGGAAWVARPGLEPAELLDRQAAAPPATGGRRARAAR